MQSLEGSSFPVGSSKPRGPDSDQELYLQPLPSRFSHPPYTTSSHLHPHFAQIHRSALKYRFLSQVVVSEGHINRNDIHQDTHFQQELALFNSGLNRNNSTGGLSMLK